MIVLIWVRDGVKREVCFPSYVCELLFSWIRAAHNL